MLEIMLSGKPPPPPVSNAFIGEVQTADFIDGIALAAALGFSNGTAINNTEPWLKVSYFGKTLYFPKKPIRHSCHWGHFNTANIVYGERTVTIQDQQYKVRLFTGTVSDPAPSAAPGGREWNDIMYRLWSGNPDGTTNNWAMYTTAELGQDSSGRFCYCQETNSSDTTRCFLRGNSTIAAIGTTAKTNTSANYGWRPILELVE
ncbi:hypothetical protein D3C86_1517040 [compost metagenome]